MSTVINRERLDGESFFGTEAGLDSQGFAGCGGGTLRFDF
jgi:hypothetical protein